jgi:HD-GYP domain-containing protein (c-di-GMP phosphodiesterase class II)
MRLAKTVYSQTGGHRQPLLTAGVTLGVAMPEALSRAGVGAVYIDDALSEGITPVTVLPLEIRERALQEVTEVFGDLSRQGPTTRIGAERIERLNAVVAQVMGAIRNSGGMASSLADLGGFDRYTLEYSVNVMTLGLAVGEAAHRRLGWIDWTGQRRHDALDERLTKLGVGLLLHDIGKLVVPPDILRKPGALTDDEMAIVREHPVAGVQMIEREALSALTKVVILGHHERHDGSGYPYGHAGSRIHPHALVGGIVDVYDALTSTRSYRPARPPHVAWEMVVSMAGRGFPVDLVRVFAETVVPYAEGAYVALSDGRRAVVSANSPGCGSRPVVRVVSDEAGDPVEPYEIDLAGTPEVSIGHALALADPEPVA